MNEGKVCINPKNSPEQNEQEKNLSYISITRAKYNLFLVKNKEDKKDEYEDDCDCDENFYY